MGVELGRRARQLETFGDLHHDAPITGEVTSSDPVGPPEGAGEQGALHVEQPVEVVVVVELRHPRRRRVVGVVVDDGIDGSRDVRFVGLRGRSRVDLLGAAMSISGAGSSSCSTGSRAPFAETVRDRRFGRVMAPLASFGRTEQPRLRLAAIVERPTHAAQPSRRRADDTAPRCPVDRRGGTCRPRTAGPPAPCRRTQRRLRSTPVAHTAVPRQANLLSRRRHAGLRYRASTRRLDPDLREPDDVPVDRRAPYSTRLRDDEGVGCDEEAVQIDRCEHHRESIAGLAIAATASAPCRGRSRR